MAQKKKHVECPPTGAERRGTLAVIESRIKAAVGYDMKAYVAHKKRQKKKGKGVKGKIVKL